MADRLPGNGWLGWLGRQVGHVKKAIQTDVTSSQPKVVYQNRKVEEAVHPEDPSKTLRRTTIDEVIAKPPHESR